MKQSKGVFRRIASVFLAVLLSLTTLLPAQKALAADLTPHLQITDFKIVSRSTKEELKDFHRVVGQTAQEIAFAGGFAFPTLGVGQIKNGDSFVIKPEAPLVVSDGTYRLLSDDPAPVEMGTLVTNKATNTMTFTFNDKIENKTNVKGSFFANGMLTYSSVEGDYTFNLPGGYTQVIKVKPPYPGDVFENEKIIKSGYGNPNWDYLCWYARINRNADAGNARVIVKDHLNVTGEDAGELVTYKEDSFVVQEVKWASPTHDPNNFTKIKDMIVTTDAAAFAADNGNTMVLLKLIDGKTGFELDFGTNVGTRSFRLEYRTTSPRNNGKVKNTIKLEWDGEEQTVYTKYNGNSTNAKYYSRSVIAVEAAGGVTHGDNSGRVVVTKFDASDANKKLEGVRFKLTSVDNPAKTHEFVTDQDGVGKSDLLDAGKYTLTEVQTREGYQLDPQDREIEMSLEPGTNTLKTVRLNIPNTPQPVDFTAKKNWVNGPAADHVEVRLQLMQHSEDQTVADAVPVAGAAAPVVTSNPDQSEWTYKWTDLPRFGGDGKALTYSVKELTAAGTALNDGQKTGNYVVSYDAAGQVVTNTYEIPKTAMKVTKKWENGPAAKPQITVALFKDGVKQDEQVLVTTPGADPTYTWTNLDATQADGTPITYTVKEIGADGNEIAENGKLGTDWTVTYQTAAGQTTIKNTYTPGTTNFKATKVWVNGSVEKPAIQFQLYRQVDGGAKEPVGAPKDLAPGVTEVEWTDLPETTADGKSITYSVDEVAVPQHYTKSVNGKVITNTYEIPKTEYTINKEWINGPAERPTIHIQLYRQIGDGAKEAVDAPVEFANGKLTHTWTNLDKTNAQGEEYTYSADEVDVPAHYTKAIDGNTIKNSYVPPTVDITGKKIWQHGPAEHPTIKLQLLRYTQGVADPEMIEEVELANGVTEKVWAGLPATDMAGRPYSYKVVEPQAPDNYEGEQTDDTTITNKYVPPVMDYTVNKIWNNGPEVKPTIKLQLFQDGAAYGPVVELANGMTTYTWTGLPVTDINGNPHTYTVDEIETPTNYEKHVEGNTVTNNYVIPKTEYTIKKVWVNGPEAKPIIQVQLYRDGEAFGAPVTLENGATEYTWTDLDKTDINGKEYVYTADEVAVPANYEKTVEGNTVTNTYIVPKTEYTVNKKWVNGPTERPTIQVQLYRDGVALGAPVELQNGSLSYTWKDLDKTDLNGKEYVYTADEVKVPAGYEKTVEGNTITNTYVPGKTSVEVQKVWKGKKLKSVEVILFADGKEAAKVTLSDENGWKHVFADLADTTTGGKKIEYTIKETEVKGYKSEISGDAVQGFTVTNTQIVREVPPAKVTPPNTGAAPIAVLPLFGSLLAGAAAVIGRKRFKNK